MTNERATALVDLRDEPFETMKQFESLVKDMRADFADEHPELGVEVIITEHQQKLLKLDAYMHGIPLKVLKTMGISCVSNVPVFVSEHEEGCPNCGSDVHWD